MKRFDGQCKSNEKFVVCRNQAIGNFLIVGNVEKNSFQHCLQLKFSIA